MAAWKAPFVIHPGSGSRSKNWPLDGFLAVASRARNAGLDPVFSFGEADDEVFAAVNLCLDYIMAETLARSCERAATLDGGVAIDLNGHACMIVLRQV